MNEARRRGRDPSPPLRWGWLVVAAGLVIAVVAGWLEYASRPTASGSALPTARQSATRDDATSRPKPNRIPPSPKPVETTTTKPKPPSAKPGRPARISLPGLGVSAPVVGIRARGGSLTPPANPRTVGWWAAGAQPGARRGSAVITGHTVHSGGGAFDDLDTLGPGAPVVVTTSRGRLRYEVTKVVTYRKKSLARNAAKVFDQGVQGRLVLITCEDWNGSAYLSNVVIFAERVG